MGSNLPLPEFGRPVEVSHTASTSGGNASGTPAAARMAANAGARRAPSVVAMRRRMGRGV